MRMLLTICPLHHHHEDHLVLVKVKAVLLLKYILYIVFVFIYNFRYTDKCFELKCSPGTSLVAQWLRTRLPMQGTQVWTLVWEDATWRGATKPVCHNYWGGGTSCTCTLEPMRHNYWNPQATTTEARAPTARALPREKPPQREAHAPQRSVALLAATRESQRTATKTQHSQK